MSFYTKSLDTNKWFYEGVNLWSRHLMSVNSKLVNSISVALLVFQYAAKIFIVYLSQIYSDQWTNSCYTDISFKGLGVYGLMWHFLLKNWFLKKWMVQFALFLLETSNIYLWLGIFFYSMHFFTNQWEFFIFVDLAEI